MGGCKAYQEGLGHHEFKGASQEKKWYVGLTNIQ